MGLTNTICDNLILGHKGTQLNYPVIGKSTVFTFQSVQPATINQVALTLKADVGADVLLNWGDGSADVVITANGYDEAHTSNYSGNNTTYNITLTGDLYSVKKLLIANEATVALNLDNLKANNVGVTYLDLTGINATGNINNLPPCTLYLNLDNVGSVVQGSINSLPKFLTSLKLVSHPLITGQLDNLPDNLIDLTIDTCILVDGTINNFNTALRSIVLKYLAQTITGTLENLPKVRLHTLVLENLGTGITGDIESLVITEADYFSGLIYLTLYPTTASNAFTGSLTTLLANNPELVTCILVNVGTLLTGSAGAFDSDYITDSTLSTISLTATVAASSTKTIRVTGRSGKRAAVVNWGDGTTDTIVMDGAEKTMAHTYTNAGTVNFSVINGYNLTTFRIIASSFTGLTGSINTFQYCKNMLNIYLHSSSTTWTGSIDTLPQKLTDLYFQSIGTSLTGNIDNLSKALKVLYFAFIGTNFTGTYKNLATTLTAITLYSVGNTIDIATGAHPAWAATAMTLIGGWSSANVDAFLISWAATAGTGTKTIEITGARTSASDAAVTTLNGKGKTINAHA